MEGKRTEDWKSYVGCFSYKSLHVWRSGGLESSENRSWRGGSKEGPAKVEGRAE